MSNTINQGFNKSFLTQYSIIIIIILINLNNFNYTVCPRSSNPFYKLQYKMGNYFLDI